MNQDKQVYERPLADIVEFELEDNIANSINFGPNLSCNESIWE